MATLYITLPQLAEKPGTVELAQVTAQPGQSPASPDVLELALKGGDISLELPEQQDKVARAIARINEAVADACAMIDGFLRQRGYALPLDKAPKILSVWTRAIARYYLHQHLISDEKTNPIARDYREAMRLLQLVADGKFSLGSSDVSVLHTGQAKFKKPERIFTHATLKDY